MECGGIFVVVFIFIFTYLCHRVIEEDRISVYVYMYPLRLDWVLRPWLRV